MNKIFKTYLIEKIFSIKLLYLYFYVGIIPLINLIPNNI